MRIFSSVLLLATVTVAAGVPSASAGDCNRGRGRVVQGRRTHAPAASQPSWSGRQVTGNGHVQSGTVVHSSSVPTVTEHVVGNNSVIVQSVQSESVRVSSPAVTQAPVVKAAALPDIVDTAVAAGSFKTLAAALGAADLVGTLKGDGPFTVFAPTDDAFAKLPAGTVEELLKPENKDKLRDILLLHVVPGKVAAADVVKLKEATTAGGGKVSISATDGVKVGTASGSATVVKTDIPAKNGLIHVIDSVLLP
jgi:uncharacterized surface protein with fasciclin (FAS1) repeats